MKKQDVYILIRKDHKTYKRKVYGEIKELSILFKDERFLKLKVQRVTIKNDKILECVDIERKMFFVFNLNEIIYYTLEKAGE